MTRSSCRWPGLCWRLAVAGASSVGSKVHLAVQSSGRAKGCRPRIGLAGEGRMSEKTEECTMKGNFFYSAKKGIWKNMKWSGEDFGSNLPTLRPWMACKILHNILLLGSLLLLQRRELRGACHFYLVGGLEHLDFFSIQLGMLCHPKWLSLHHFSEG